MIALSFPLVTADTEAPSTQWQRSFEGSQGYSVLEVENGGYALTGVNGSASLLIKTDSSGNLLWTKAHQIGGTGTFLPYLVQTEDGGYTLAGTWENNFALVRFDFEGNVMWEKIYEHSSVFSSLRSLIRTSDGGYAIVGTYLNQPPSDGQTWFVKLDNLGNIQWNKTIGSVGDFVNSVLQTTDGGYAIIGTCWASETLPATPKIIKTDSDGNIQWSKTYGGVGNGIFYYTESFSGIISDDGGYLIAGFAGETSSSWKAWLFKTDPQGKLMWNETYGDIGSLAHSVVKTQDGGYAFAGVVNKLDAWIVKTDANGNMDWNLTFEGSSIETFCNLMVQASDGGYAIVGTKGDKIWFAKIAALSHPSPPITQLVIVILAITIGLTIASYILNKYARRKRITGVS
jgi:hypothetical protein